MFRLDGKSAIVTGGARGIGFSLAEAFALNGMNVALLDLLDSVSESESADQLARSHAVDAVGIATDVTDQQAVVAAFAQVTEKIGVPQVLLTAAGICVWSESVDVPAEQWRKVIGVNLDGTFYAAQAFARGSSSANSPEARSSYRRCPPRS